MKSLRLPLAALFLVLLATSTYAQKLSADEQKIIDYVDAHADDAIGLLEKVVNIDSPSEDVAGVKQVGMVFKRETRVSGSIRHLDRNAG